MGGRREWLGLLFATGVLATSVGSLVATHVTKRWPQAALPPGLLLVLGLTWLLLVAASLDAVVRKR